MPKLQDKFKTKAITEDAWCKKYILFWKLTHKLINIYSQKPTVTQHQLEFRIHSFLGYSSLCLLTRYYFKICKKGVCFTNITKLFMNNDSKIVL